MKYEPHNANILCPVYSDWTWWSKKVGEDLVLRWHAQGGTEHTHLMPWMTQDFGELMEVMGNELSAIHEKAFKTISANRAKREHGTTTV